MLTQNCCGPHLIDSILKKLQGAHSVAAFVLLLSCCYSVTGLYSVRVVLVKQMLSAFYLEGRSKPASLLCKCDLV